jgi:hypothetical protein
MFCPKCRAEYKEGVVKCADCQIPLVAELPTSRALPDIDIEFEEILATFNPGDVAIIKSVLDDVGIPYVFEGENFMYTYSLVEPARLMVPKARVAEALDALKDLKLSIKGISVGEDKEDKDEEDPKTM